MYERFLEKWFAQSETDNRSGRLLSLWVYGREPHLQSFSAELVRLMKAKRRRMSIAPTDSLAAELDASQDLNANPEDRARARARTKELETVPLLILNSGPGLASLVGRSLLWTDSIVNERYSGRRATIVLSTVDPVAAYESRGIGQEDYSMPRIVGRILEDGDAIEVTEDGAFCAEFVFSSRAAADYRIRILKDRVGRVAVMRPPAENDEKASDEAL